MNTIKKVEHNSFEQLVTTIGQTSESMTMMLMPFSQTALQNDAIVRWLTGVCMARYE